MYFQIGRRGGREGGEAASGDSGGWLYYEYSVLDRSDWMYTLNVKLENM